jgi:hypothetical protein
LTTSARSVILHVQQPIRCQSTAPALMPSLAPKVLKPPRKER